MLYCKCKEELLSIKTPNPLEDRTSKGFFSLFIYVADGLDVA